MINHVQELEESIENRDLTVLKAPDDSKWLFQFRKFTVACTYAPGYDYREFAAAANQLTIKVRSHGKCIVNRDSQSDGQGAALTQTNAPLNSFALVARRPGICVSDSFA